MKVSFEVPGEPKGKQRPRVVDAGLCKRTYTPEQTVIYENKVQWSYIQQCGRVKLSPPISASIIGVFPIPQKTSKKKREEMRRGSVPYTKKIDCDNLAKIVLDALNHIAYDDDAGVSVLSVAKVYGEDPKVCVTLEELEPGADILIHA